MRIKFHYCHGKFLHNLRKNSYGENCYKFLPLFCQKNIKVLSNRPQVSEIRFILPRMEIFGATSGGNVNENGGGVNIGMSSVWGMAMPSPKPPSPSPSPPPSLTEPWSVGSQKRYFLSDAAAANDTRHSSRIQLNFITITIAISVSMSVSAASRFFSNRFHSGLFISFRFFARTVFFGLVPFFLFSLNFRRTC